MTHDESMFGFRRTLHSLPTENLNLPSVILCPQKPDILLGHQEITGCPSLNMKDEGQKGTPLDNTILDIFVTVPKNSVTGVSSR